jgi:hypothetical protein
MQATQQAQPAAPTASLSDRQSFDIEEYLTDEFLGSLDYTGCVLLGTSSNAPGRRVSAILPDRSWFTLEVFAAPSGRSPRHISYQRGFPDGSSVEFVWERDRHGERLARLNAISRDDRKSQPAEVRESAIAARLAALAARASDLSCKKV